MHVLMILLALGGALSARRCWQPGWQPGDSDWSARWLATWQALVLPPLWLLATAIAIVFMGWQGTMFQIPVGWCGYAIAVAFLATAGGLLARRARQTWQTRQQTCRQPVQAIAGVRSRLLAIDVPFAGQIGFWSPELAISQGLLDCLAPDQVEAVLAHERAHYHYRDTFWFFWLGWLHRLTAWLPRSQALWQELLLLRELRADAWAAQSVDPLLLAESLLQVVQVPAVAADERWATFADRSAPQRFAARIDALLAGSVSAPPGGDRRCWWCLASLPLLAAFWHHAA